MVRVTLRVRVRVRAIVSLRRHGFFTSALATKDF